MKLLLLVFLIPLCHGHSLNKCASPNDVRVATNGEGDDLWLDISWSKTENTDPEDPILGYKVKMWIIKPRATYQYESNAEKELVPKPKEELPHFEMKEDNTDNLSELDIPANKTKATIKGLKQGVTYEIGVHSYTAKCKGSVTQKMRITLGSSKKE